MADIRFFRGEAQPQTELQRLAALTSTMERTATLNPSAPNTKGLETLRALNQTLDQIITDGPDTNPSI